MRIRLAVVLAPLVLVGMADAGQPASAAQAPTLTAQVSFPDYRSVVLQWTGIAGPTGVFLIERSITGSESATREWHGLADVKVDGQGGARPDANPTTVAYRDLDVKSAGWYCYRVRAKADDFAWSNEACAVRPVVDGPPPPASDLPVPAAVRWEAIVQPPDLGGVLRIFAWDWPPAGGVDAVIEASVQPRLLTDVVPPFRLYARIGASQPARISVTTLNWRGPYCFRVRFAARSELGEPSAAACIPRTAETAPYDIAEVKVVQRPFQGTAVLSWEYRYFPTTVTIQRSTRSRAADSEWRTIASDVPARLPGKGNTGEYIDLHSEFGTACYRVKANLGGQGEFEEDSLWSPETCIAWPRPITDGPFPPDVGNSTAAPQGGLHPFGWALEVAGLTLVFLGVANWWAWRGLR